MSDGLSEDIALGNVTELTKNWSDDMKLSLAQSWGWALESCEGGKDDGDQYVLYTDVTVKD